MSDTDWQKSQTRLGEMKTGQKSMLGQCAEADPWAWDCSHNRAGKRKTCHRLERNPERAWLRKTRKELRNWHGN
jgi:hypothetical protein